VYIYVLLYIPRCSLSTRRCGKACARRHLDETRLTRHARCRGNLPRYRATAGWARYILINIVFVCVSSFIRVNPIFIYMCVCVYTVATRLTRHARCRGSLPRYRATAGWARYILINILFVCVSSFIRVNPILYICVCIYICLSMSICVCVYTAATRPTRRERFRGRLPRYRATAEWARYIYSSLFIYNNLYLFIYSLNHLYVCVGGRQPRRRATAGWARYIYIHLFIYLICFYSFFHVCVRRDRATAGWARYIYMYICM